MSQDLVDLVCIVYHEGRLVRRAIRAGRVPDAERYALLAGLPQPRSNAWHHMRPVRAAAYNASAPNEIAHRFEKAFDLTIGELAWLFEQEIWTECTGGARWAAIARQVAKALTLHRIGNYQARDAVVATVFQMRHNTGTVGEKLRLLREIDSEVQ